MIAWTGFPTGLRRGDDAAALPLWLAVLGIVLRGAGFAFRKEVETLRWRRMFGATFAFSSLVTPFFMGTVVGCIVAGRVGVTPGDTLAAWTSPTSLLLGGLFVAMCAYLAAVYLIGEAARRGQIVARATTSRRRAAAAGRGAARSHSRR